jgi:hypothetical protein
MIRPFWRTLAAVWLFRALLGWLLALPFIAAVADSGVGRMLEGDRALFEPGGLFLAELGRSSGSIVGATLSTTWPYFVAAFALRTVPQGALLQQALAPSSSVRNALGAAWARLTSLVTLAVAELVAKLVVVVLVLLVERSAPQGAAGELVRRLALVPGAALLGVGLFGLSVFADVRRGLFFADPELSGAALGPTWDQLRAHALPLFGGYLLRTGMSVLAIAAAARLVEWIDVGRAGGWRVLSVLCVHQAALVLITWLDAQWARRVMMPLQPPASFL